MQVSDHTATIRAALRERRNYLAEFEWHNWPAQEDSRKSKIAAIDAALAYLDTLDAMPQPDWAYTGAATGDGDA